MKKVIAAYNDRSGGGKNDLMGLHLMGDSLAKEIEHVRAKNIFQPNPSFGGIDPFIGHLCLTSGLTYSPGREHLMAKLSYSTHEDRSCPICEEDSQRDNLLYLYGTGPNLFAECAKCGIEFAAIAPKLRQDPPYDYWVKELSEHSRTPNYLFTTIVKKYNQCKNTLIPDLRTLLYNFNLFKDPIVSIGCGAPFDLYGAIIDPVRTQRINIVGVDSSKTLIPKLDDSFSQNICRHDFTATFIDSDEWVASVADNSIGLLMAHDFLEHIQNARSFIRKAFSALKPGGLLFISGIPNNESHRALRLGAASDTRTLPEHITFFNPRTLSALLESENFIAVDPRKSGFNFSQNGRGMVFFSQGGVPFNFMEFEADKITNWEGLEDFKVNPQGRHRRLIKKNPEDRDEASRVCDVAFSYLTRLGVISKTDRFSRATFEPLQLDKKIKLLKHLNHRINLNNFVMDVIAQKP